MSKTQKRLLYFGYFITVAAFSIYCLFPSDTIKDYIAFHLSKAKPDLNITIGHITPTFPPGLKLHAVTLSHLHHSLIDAEQIKIIPGFLSLFRSKVTFLFKGSTHEGTIQGNVAITKSKSARQVEIDAKLSGIQIKAIPAILNLSGRRLSGILDGNVSCKSNKKSGITGDIQLTLSDSKVDLLTPFFSLGSLAFRNIEADVVINNHQLRIKKCSIKGNKMDGSVAGVVTIKDPPAKSVLSLMGTIKLHQLFLAELGKNLPVNLFAKNKIGESGFSFRMKGTLDHPSFSLK